MMATDYARARYLSRRTARSRGFHLVGCDKRSEQGREQNLSNRRMLNNDDLKWIAATSTELNAMLQQISRYSDLARQHKGEYNYITLLGERVENAAKTAQSIFDRVTSRILEATTNKATPALSGPPSFTVVRSATETSLSMLPKLNELRAGTLLQPAKISEEKGTRDPRRGHLEIKNPNGNRELILIVEDEAQVAELAGEMLTDEGYKVIIAHDGFEALRIYEKMGNANRSCHSRFLSSRSWMATPSLMNCGM